MKFFNMIYKSFDYFENFIFAKIFKKSSIQFDMRHDTLYVVWDLLG